MDNCYNFVHPHMGLNGRTPAEAAGMNLNLEKNKLMTLIKLFHNNNYEYLWLKKYDEFNVFSL